MRDSLLFFFLLTLMSQESFAQVGRKSITVGGSFVERSGGVEGVKLCFKTEAGRGSKVCHAKGRFVDDVPKSDNEVTISVAYLCQHIINNAPIVEDSWYVVPSRKPKEIMYHVDCREKRAYRFVSQRSNQGLPPKGSQHSSSSQGGMSRSSGLSPLMERLEDLDSRLTPRIEDLTRGQDDLRQKIETFREELEEQLRAIEKAQKVSCFRVDGEYERHEEVMVGVAGSVLRFLKIRPLEEDISIGLTDAKATELLQEIQQMSGKAVVPRIFRSVPEVSRSVTAFFLQDRLIDPDLYAKVMDGADPRRVSYQDATRFIEELNGYCEGRVQFALPTEEQFLAAARIFYDPVENGLKPCPALERAGSPLQPTQMLGHSWQLTRSLCEPFDDHPKDRCPEGTYVRKGGTATSENSLECMPEYRSAAPYAVAQEDTSFRLVLSL